jgi:hypothetical protein
MKTRYRRSGIPLPVPLRPLWPLPLPAKPAPGRKPGAQAQTRVNPACLAGPGTFLVASHLFLQLHVWGRH